MPFLDFKSTVALPGHARLCITHLPGQSGTDDPENKQLKGALMKGRRKLGKSTPQSLRTVSLRAWGSIKVRLRRQETHLTLSGMLQNKHAS
jgi:hypothetical protein